VSDESGQSLIDVLLLGLLFLVPLIWGLGVLSQLHAAALATTAAVREAGMSASASHDPTEAGRAVTDAVAVALSDQGLDPRLASVRWAAPSGLQRGGEVAVVVRYPVSVLQAPFLGRVSGPSIWVTATTVARIDPFRSRE
jgi:hypothetical protein